MVLGVAAVVGLEILFLRFGPSLYISAYAIVLIFLGLLVLAVFAGEVLSVGALRTKLDEAVPPRWASRNWAAVGHSSGAKEVAS